jgi:hypothetical protein
MPKQTTLSALSLIGLLILAAGSGGSDGGSDSIIAECKTLRGMSSSGKKVCEQGGNCAKTIVRGYNQVLRSQGATMSNDIIAISAVTTAQINGVCE